ncbi:MAG: aminotransferase class IV [Chitinophagaceae bacterium]|nr:aminotransferase class IV [Chitinophagaceae bacterium]
MAKKNKHQKFARIRLSVVRGNGGLYDAENHNPNYIVQTWALPDGKGTLNQNGLVLNIYKEALKSCDAFSNLKHNNFLPYTMAALFAKKNNCNDALVLNGYNRICDSSIANVFIVKDEIIYTPPLSEGCIAGVTAAYVIAKLQNSLYKVIEKPLQINDVLNADEVFLTNSIQNIQWVKQIDNSVYKNEMIQKIYAACKLV